jgi:hypothetical protein
VLPSSNSASRLAASYSHVTATASYVIVHVLVQI